MLSLSSVRVCVCVCICTCAQTCVHMHMCTDVCMCICTDVCVCACAQMCVYVHILLKHLMPKGGTFTAISVRSCLVFMLICCTCLEFCYPAVCMHVHNCVWMCVCVCTYFSNIYCLKGVGGVGELTAACVWSCFILIWCICTEFCNPAQYCSKVLR